MRSSPRVPSLLVCALALFLSAEAVAAKCPNPLRVDGVVAAAYVHAGAIRCWAESSDPGAPTLTVLVFVTKDYVASLGDDVSSDEAVAAAVAAADAELRELWEELTAAP